MPAARASNSRRAIAAAAVLWILIGGRSLAADALDPVAVAERLLASERNRQGALAVRARLEERWGAEPSEPGRFPVQLEILVPLAGEAASARTFRVTLVTLLIDGEPELWRQERPVLGAAGAKTWLLRAPLEVAEDFAEVALVVEEVESDRWGAVRVELGGEPLPAAAGDVVVDEILAEAPASTASAPVLVRLVPPKQQPATGKVRLHALASTAEVDRVIFLLDGREVATDDRLPYSQSVDLGERAALHELAVVALAADGVELGRDTRRINAPPRPLEVVLAIEQRPAGAAAVARLSVPPERRLEAVEFYRNEELLATRTSAPFEVPLPAGAAGPAEYLRAVARLDDGSSIDDVLLLAGEEGGERLEVNLVQVFAVVTDRAGTPVRGLLPEDFSLRMGGNGSREEVPIERFAPADDLPLTLGLVFDSSESMWALMPEAKQAGAAFLAQALRPGDSAFLVDFDDRPRVAHAATDNVGDLLRSFGRLVAGGSTVLYDAILFAMLQFEPGPGRKALVVLTDGEDYGSQLTGGRCAELGRRSGIPVYLVDLSGVHDPRQALSDARLEAISAATGGRTYHPGEVSQLATAYDQLLGELRNQYLLAFTTERPLSGEELAAIDVAVRGRGLRVRAWSAGLEAGLR